MNSIDCGTDCLKRRGPHYDRAALPQKEPGYSVNVSQAINNWSARYLGW